MNGPRWEAGPKEVIMSALVLWINIPLMVLAFGLMVGIPLWMVLRHPDQHPKENRSMPAYLVPRPRMARTKQRAMADAAYADRRGGLTAM
jgi:hypothetical protein